MIKMQMQMQHQRKNSNSSSKNKTGNNNQKLMCCCWRAVRGAVAFLCFIFFFSGQCTVLVVVDAVGVDVHSNSSKGKHITLLKPVVKKKAQSGGGGPQHKPQDKQTADANKRIRDDAKDKATRKFEAPNVAVGAPSSDVVSAPKNGFKNIIGKIPTNFGVKQSVEVCTQVSVTYSALTTVSLGYLGGMSIDKNGNYELKVEVSGGLSFGAKVPGTKIAGYASIYMTGSLAIKGSLPNAAAKAKKGLANAVAKVKKGLVVKVLSRFLMDRGSARLGKITKQMVMFRKTADEALRSIINDLAPDAPMVADDGNNDYDLTITTIAMMRGFISYLRKFTKSWITKIEKQKDWKSLAEYQADIESHWREIWLHKSMSKSKSYMYCSDKKLAKDKNLAGVKFTPVQKLMCACLIYGIFLDEAKNSKLHMKHKGHGDNVFNSIPKLLPEFFPPAEVTKWEKQLEFIKDFNMKLKDFYIDTSSAVVDKPDGTSIWTINNKFFALSSKPEDLEKFLSEMRPMQDIVIKEAELTGTFGLTVGGDPVGYCSPDSNPVQMTSSRTYTWKKTGKEWPAKPEKSSPQNTLTFVWPFDAGGFSFKATATTRKSILKALAQKKPAEFIALEVQVRWPLSKPPPKPLEDNNLDEVPNLITGLFTPMMEIKQASLKDSLSDAIPKFLTGITKVVPTSPASIVAFGASLVTALKSKALKVSPVAFSNSMKMGINIKVVKKRLSDGKPDGKKWEVNFSVVHTTSHDVGVDIGIPGSTVKFQGYLNEGRVLQLPGIAYDHEKKENRWSWL